MLQALDEAAVVLDHSIAQPRPRYFAFVGLVGPRDRRAGRRAGLGHDVNLAVVAGAADLVERQTLEWLGQAFGYPVATGTFSSGGTVSTMTALAAARERALPGSRHTGLSGRPGALYASADVHESVMRAAELLGIGRDRVRGIPIDAQRRMRADACAEAIDADRAAGVAPIAVVATAGTTLTGAVDPVDALADVCEARGVWLHVDGAYGLPAALVESHAPLFKGLARADSVTVDAHKWLFVPKACGVLMVREAEWLERAFSHDATYMPPRAGEPDAVDRTLEYSRPFRSLKLWLALRVHGLAAYRGAIERNIAEARLFADLVKERDELELLGEPELSVVPFRHVATERPLDEHNRALAAALRADGRVYVSGADIDGTACLRPCFVNFRTSPDDVRVLRDVVIELGAKLA